jgi:RimJ/RimL family protein N-acetyltransferase
MQLTLRPVDPSDLDTFFRFQRDEEACKMAAFTVLDPSDRSGFDTHWAQISADPTITNRTIMLGDQIVGSLGKFQMFGLPQVTYWIGKEFWGRGIATAALREFLKEQTDRPIYGSAAKDNAGSIRVLEKCGFVHFATEKGFANSRGEEIEEVVMKLES